MEKINDTINRINEKMKERADEADAKKQKQAEEVKKAADDVAALEQKARAAGLSGNDAEYKKAYKAAEDAKQLLSMKRDRLATIESTPLVTREEYENAAEELGAEFDAMEKEALEQITEHLQAVAAIANDLYNTAQAGNTALHMMEYTGKLERQYSLHLSSIVPEHIRNALTPITFTLHIPLAFDVPRLFF